MNVIFDSRWIGSHGIGRFAREVRSRLPKVVDLSSKGSPASAFDPLYLAARLSWSKRTSLFLSPGYNAPLRTAIPFIFTIHDLAHIDVPELKTALKSAYYEYVLKSACHRASLVLTVSEFSKQRIREWSGLNADRILNVGNGVDPAFSIHGPAYPHS